MAEHEASEGEPSLSVSFRVVSRDSSMLEVVARKQGVRVRYSKSGIASLSLVDMRRERVSQEEFEQLLEAFTQELSNALNRLGGLDGVRLMDLAEVRITIFANSNLNAGTYIPRDLLGIVQAHELDLYFDVL